MTQRKPFLLLALLLATSATGVALAASPAGQRPTPSRMDANGDGVIDRQEAASHPRLAQRFGRHGRGGHGHAGHGGRDGFMLRGMDTDNDGRISAAEYRAHFDRLDVNKDGFSDQADRQARAEQRRTEWFTQADTDKDGKLSQAELDAARGKERSRGPRGPMPPQAPAAK